MCFCKYSQINYSENTKKKKKAFCNNHKLKLTNINHMFCINLIHMN